MIDFAGSLTTVLRLVLSLRPSAIKVLNGLQLLAAEM